MSVLPPKGSPPLDELEALAARPLPARAEPGERIAAGRALKTLEALLAGLIDLATVEAPRFFSSPTIS